jgi:predicted exporter
MRATARFDAVHARFAAWLLFAALLGGFFVLRVQPALRVETDIMALLPATERDTTLEQTLRVFSARLGRDLVFLVGGGSFQDGVDAAQAFAEALRGSPAFAEVRLDVTPDVVAPPGWLPWRHGLLAPADRERLRAGQAEALARDALESLYAPAGAPRPLPVSEDPLNFTGAYLLQHSATLPGARLRAGMLHASDGGREWLVVLAQTAGATFSITDQDRLRETLAAAREAAQARGAQVLGSGVALHAAAASDRARREMTLFGTCATVGVVLLTLLAFASLRPLLLSLGVLGMSVLAGLTACTLVFGRLDLLTLVFGTSLIGVAVDYAMHYMADQFRGGQWRGRDALAHVARPILTGHACAVLGYLALLATPFPGLQQMATFSIAGLICACATVLCVYPVLARRGRATNPPLLRLTRRLGGTGAPPTRPRALRWGAAAALVLMAAGALRVEWVDDVRLLSSSPDWVRAEEAELRRLLGHAPESRFFLVTGDDAQQVLEHEEALRERLDPLVRAGVLAGYRAVSQSLPSLRRQQENRALVAATVYEAGGPAARLLSQVGLPPGRVGALRAAAASAPGLTPAGFFALRESAPAARLWLDQGGHASAVQLQGVGDAAALRAAAGGLPGVRYVDRLAETSQVLQRYRIRATELMLAAYAVVAAALALRYGARAALVLMLPPLGGAAATLALLGLLGMPVNLFNLLALLLVLGMGIDYAVFLREGRAAPTPVLMAILLSTLSALMSFGLLAFSATPFIRSVGLTLAIGITLVFLIALALHRAGAVAGGTRA